MYIKFLRTYFLLRWLLTRRQGVRFLAAARNISFMSRIDCGCRRSHEVIGYRSKQPDH